MRRLVIGLLITGCYDSGATENLDSNALPAPPSVAAPRLLGTTAVRAEGASKDTALPGVEACALGEGRALCASSDDDGFYELGPFVPNTRFKVRYEKSGYAPLVAEYDIPEYSLAANVFLFSSESVALSARRLGMVHEPSRGAVLISVHTINYSGIVLLEGASARALGEARFTYASTAHELDPNLEATTDSGWALALGVLPGRYTVELSHVDRAATCGRLTADMSMFEDSAVVEAVPGEITMTKLYCLR
jgi:hypothetical protein